MLISIRPKMVFKREQQGSKCDDNAGKRRNYSLIVVFAKNLSHLFWSFVRHKGDSLGLLIIGTFCPI
jgi:hypothetical protein